MLSEAINIAGWLCAQKSVCTVRPTPKCKLHITIYDYTSSTAQGSGGSFKNRKPIGEVCFLCITDGRAIALMDRKVVGVVFFEMVAVVAVVTSPQLLDVAWCCVVVV